jgi:hypothetical protein
VWTNGVSSGDTPFSRVSCVAIAFIELVADDFFSEVNLLRATGRIEALSEEKRVWRKRAFLFLKKEKPTDSEERPTKRHRIKAHSALIRLDNGMNVSFGHGLAQYIMAKEVADRPAKPEDWSRLSLSRDEGGDMGCMSHFLQRVMNCNLDSIIDFNHAEWNALKSAVKDVQMWGHLLVFDFGLYQEDRFYETLRGAWREYLEVGDASCPLWNDFVPKILRDKGELARLGASSTPSDLFQDVQSTMAVCIIFLPWPQDVMKILHVLT